MLDQILAVFIPLDKHFMSLIILCQMLVEYSVTLSSLSAGCCVDEAHPSTFCSAVSSIGGETGTETLVRDREGDPVDSWFNVANY